MDPGASLRLRSLRANVDGGTPEPNITEDVVLRGPAGEAVTGRPGLFAAGPGLAGQDEEVLDLQGNVVAPDGYGARFGGATRSTGGQIWLGESRRNGLWRLGPDGAVAARYVPAGTPAGFGSPVLPEVFAQRRLNLSLEPGQRYGGFGAVAFDATRSTVFAACRLPLDNPDTSDDAASRASRISRMVEVDAATGAVVGEYAVVLERVGNALEGMTRVDSPFSGDAGLHLLEAATDAAGFRAIFRIDVSQATNLRTLSPADYGAVSAALETSSPAQLADLAVSVVPVRKTLRFDLRALGLGGGVGQPSALGNIAEGYLAVAFNDRFQLEQATLAAGGTPTVQGLDGQTAQLALILLESNAADFVDDGESVYRSHPIQGLPQPLDMAVFQVDGEDRLFTADGGLARVLEPSGGAQPFDERMRVGGLLLDTGVFTNAAAIQDPTISGDLLVSSIGSDLNGDMLVDRLLAFGSRSISLRSRTGDELWRTDRSLTDRAFEIQPDAVSGGATLYGIRPRSLALGSVGTVGVLAAALEGAGAVMLYDLESPQAPVLAGVGSRATRPVDLDLAPIAGTTLFVTDAARGRVEVRRLTRL